MKYLKRFNESNIGSGDNIVSSIRSDIEDILVEFKFGYDIRFVRYNTPHSKNNFQLQIAPKGYPDSNDAILIDEDILDDLKRVCSSIELEIGFKYSHFYEMTRPDGRGSPVKIWGYAAACFAWRTAVSQIKHLQMLPQFNRLEQTAGKSDH